MIALALLAPLLAGQTIGSVSPSLLKRDDSKSNAFAPGTTEGCPAGWPTCGSSGICYNPDEGATCCPGGTCSSFSLVPSTKTKKKKKKKKKEASERC
jgi:hypothetical protein